MSLPLFIHVDPDTSPFGAPAEVLYPAFESAMGDTMVRELDDQADADDLWRRAVALQIVLDRIAGVA